MSFTKEEYFDHKREFIRKLYTGFPPEDFVDSYYRRMPPIEKAKIIIDSMDNLYTDCGIGEMPADLYAELLKNISFIRNEIAEGRCPEKMLNIMQQCLEIGENLIASVILVESGGNDSIADLAPLSLPERVIDKDELFENRGIFLILRKGKFKMKTDLCRYLRRQSATSISMLNISLTL